jgi:hypothetical protein
MTDAPVALIRAAPADLPAFKRALQAAFALAVADEPGALDEGPIPRTATSTPRWPLPERSRCTSCRMVKRSAGPWSGSTPARITILLICSTSSPDATAMGWAQGMGRDRGAVSAKPDLGNAHPVFREAEHPFLRQRLRLPDRRILQRTAPTRRCGNGDRAGDEMFRFIKTMR